MTKAIFIFVPIFLVAMFVNQMSYGGCFESYCLVAAFPKIAFFSIAATAFIAWVNHEPKNTPEQKKKLARVKEFPLQSNNDLSDENQRTNFSVNTKEVTSRVNEIRLVFASFGDAATKARELAALHGKFVNIYRTGTEFYIESTLQKISVDMQPPIESRTRTRTKSYRSKGQEYDIDDLRRDSDELRRDSDELDTQKEIAFEIFDYAESLARSDDEGWFYSEKDGGWENNISDESQ